MIELEKEHLEKLNQWRKAALEKACGDVREYLRLLIYIWHAQVLDYVMGK